MEMYKRLPLFDNKTLPSSKSAVVLIPVLDMSTLTLPFNHSKSFLLPPAMFIQPSIRLLPSPLSLRKLARMTDHRLCMVH